MPLPTIPKSLFPNVPNLPGVPQLNRANNVINTVLGIAQGISAIVGTSSTAFKWGIYNSANALVVTPDNIINFDNRNEWDVSDYPVEQGSFASYNKVIIPFENSVRLTKGGSLADRSNLLAQIDAIAGDTNLYTIVTPEKSYTNCNILRYEVTRRAQSGAYYLQEVDIYFRQILQVNAQYSTSTTSTANAKNPAALPTVNQGNIQPQSQVAPLVATYAQSAISQAPR